MKLTRLPACMLAMIVTAALLTSCATTSHKAGQPCTAQGFSVHDGFAGARRGTCTVIGPNEVKLDIRPESSGYINDSPWFAFRVESSRSGEATISLKYHGGHHRYWPKISDDGLTWAPLGEDKITVAANEKSANLTIPLNGKPVWVAAQELITPSVHRAWAEKISSTSGYTFEVIGQSRREQNIYAFDTMPGGREMLLLIGRQHPPEVSGAFGFDAFAATVLGNSALAQKFRERFRVVAVPLLNPDGVLGGNWRHNLGDTDLNRDWGKFTQPETAAIGKLLDELDANDGRLRMFVDFHSTRENVFYTQQDPTVPAGFTARWLDKAAEQIIDYPFRNSNGPATSPYISKNYIYSRYGIPAVTFEAGDETDRAAIRGAAKIFAEELMRQMLDQEY